MGHPLRRNEGSDYYYWSLSFNTGDSSGHSLNFPSLHAHIHTTPASLDVSSHILALQYMRHAVEKSSFNGSKENLPPWSQCGVARYLDAVYSPWNLRFIPSWLHLKFLVHEVTLMQALHWVIFDFVLIFINPTFVNVYTPTSVRCARALIRQRIILFSVLEVRSSVFDTALDYLQSKKAEIGIHTSLITFVSHWIFLALLISANSECLQTSYSRWLTLQKHKILYLQ